MNWDISVSSTDLPPYENQNTFLSLIIRYWCSPDGKVRGQLINPVTKRAFAFASIDDLYQVLRRVMQVSPDVDEKPEEET